MSGNGWALDSKLFLDSIVERASQSASGCAQRNFWSALYVSSPASAVDLSGIGKVDTESRCCCCPLITTVDPHSQRVLGLVTKRDAHFAGKRLGGKRGLRVDPRKRLQNTCGPLGCWVNVLGEKIEFFSYDSCALSGLLHDSGNDRVRIFCIWIAKDVLGSGARPVQVVIDGATVSK